MDLLKYVTVLLNEDITSKLNFIAGKQSDKIEDAFKKDGSVLTGEATAKEILEELAKADPSKNGAAINWIVRMYIAKQFKLEDVRRLSKDIDVFLKFKNKMENKDLNSYPDLKTLYAAVAPFIEKPDQAASGKAEKKEIKKGVKYIINTPNFKALIPKTEEAACFYGAGTKWCTAATDGDNQFENYNSRGDLVIIIAGEGAKQRKFQLHYEDDAFMDEQDSEVGKADISYLSSFPQYKDLLDILIKKHYFPEDHKE